MNLNGLIILLLWSLVKQTVEQKSHADFHHTFYKSEFLQKNSRNQTVQGRIIGGRKANPGNGQNKIYNLQ